MAFIEKECNRLNSLTLSALYIQSLAYIMFQGIKLIKKNKYSKGWTFES